MHGLEGSLRAPQALALAISRTIIRLLPSSHITVMRSNNRAASSGMAADCICRQDSCHQCLLCSVLWSRLCVCRATADSFKETPVEKKCQHCGQNPPCASGSDCSCMPEASVA